MAVVWIDTVDIATAKRLVQQLVSDFGGESVMLQAVGHEVRLVVEFESSAVVTHAFEAIANWLDQTGIHAQISVGSSYERTLRVASGQ